MKQDPEPLSARATAAIPQGVQAYLGPDVVLRRRIESELEDVFRGWSYSEIILPLFDYFDTFARGVGPGLVGRTYRFVDRDGALLALRPDLTTLVAKTAASRLMLEKPPLRLFYRGEVFRYERPKAGRQRVFTQVGLELIGTPLPAADIEILLIVDEGLRRLGLGTYKLAIGHAAFFQGICRGLELSPETISHLADAVDRKDVDELERMTRRLNIPEEKKVFLASLPHLSGGIEVIHQARAVVRNPESRRALGELEKIHQVFTGLGRQDSLALDLSEVRGLDYYTGIIFKVYTTGFGFEIGGGGRYDRLMAVFGRDLPAVGFSLSQDRLAQTLQGLEGGKQASGQSIPIRIGREPAVAPYRAALQHRAEGDTIRLDFGLSHFREET